MPRRPLTDFERLCVNTDATAGKLTLAVLSGERDTAAAAAEVLAAAQGRADVLDRVVETLSRAPARLADWPPRTDVLALLQLARDAVS